MPVPSPALGHTLGHLLRLVAVPGPSPSPGTTSVHPTWALLALLVGPLALALAGLGIVKLRQNTK